ncbi:MAG: inositol monophosphatase family protein [Thermodesulfobacteriota bacterium]
MDLDWVRRVGIEAAEAGGHVLTSHFGKISHVVEKKGNLDIVTEADSASEARIVETIRNAFPDHSILAEERGVEPGDPRFRWIIDPLDGTTNFAHGLKFFCVSIAFEIDHEVVMGVVFDPATGEMFSAVSGKGAMLNDRPISISRSRKVSESLLVTGFPYNFKEILDPLIKRFSNCLRASRGVRRLGSAALDICYVACGRFAGFWEQNLNPWDTAAGYRIAAEAGAVISDFQKNPFTLDKKEILVTNGYIHNEMITLLAINQHEE